MRVRVGLVSCLFAFWCWLGRRPCGLLVWAAATVQPGRARLGVKGQMLRGVARVPRLVIRLGWVWAAVASYAVLMAEGLGSAPLGVAAPVGASLASIGFRFAWLLLDGVRRDIPRRWLAG